MSFFLSLFLLLNSQATTEAAPGRLNLALERFCGDERSSVDRADDAARKLCAEFHLAQALITPRPDQCSQREICGPCRNGTASCQLVDSCSGEVSVSYNSACGVPSPLIAPDDRPRRPREPDTVVRPELFTPPVPDPYRYTPGGSGRPLPTLRQFLN